MERSRLTLFWALMLALSSCLRPAAAESKYRRRPPPPLPGQAAPLGLQHTLPTPGYLRWPSTPLEEPQKPAESARISISPPSS